MSSIKVKYVIRGRRSAFRAFLAGIGSLVDFQRAARPTRHAEINDYPDFDIPEQEALRADAEALAGDFRIARDSVLEEVGVG